MLPPAPSIKSLSPTITLTRSSSSVNSLGVARVYRTFGADVASVAPRFQRVFYSRFLYETNGMHKYFRRCSRPRREDSRCDFRLQGELVSLITVSVHEYDCRATQLTAARKLAWRHRLLLRSWIYVSAFSNAVRGTPKQKKTKEKDLPFSGL